MTSAWVFVAALTVCSAPLSSLGNSGDTDWAIQQAEEILDHFASYTWQGKRYGFIIKKLSKTAKDYAQALEKMRHSSRNTAMPEIFSLNRAVSGKLNDAMGSADLTWGLGRKAQYDPRGFSHVTSTYTAENEIQMGETIVSNSGITEPSFWAISPLWPPANYGSAADIFQTCKNKHDDSTTDSFLTSAIQSSFILDAERSSYIWGLNWGASLQ